MHNRTTHDWATIVRHGLQSLELQAVDQQQVITELAGHLEEVYDDARSRGLSETEAFQFALQGIGDWPVLAVRISRAKHEKEQPMNHRVKSLWLPGLASLAAANLFLLLLTRISLQPQSLLRLNSGLGKSLYIAWIFAQLLFGALGAFLSRRAGGTRTARIVAGIFPAIVMFGLCAVFIPITAVAERNVFVLHHPLYYALGVFLWVVLPGVALLLGAAPFLRERHLSEA